MPNDPLTSFRSLFHFPKHEGKQAVYLCGNSLGLQPKSAKKEIDRQLQQWRDYAVEGWFSGADPWLEYHRPLSKMMAPVVGALPEEVVVMNTLTVNLHLLMASFYRPGQKRYKIIMETGAFPSDQYAIAAQVRWHGFNPADAIVEVSPRENEHCLRTEDIVAAIERCGEATALILFSGVQYYTGQFFDIPSITAAAHHAGAVAAFDLAHAAGNVPLALHDWNVDFAVWCGYKYLNGGPGGPGGVFVHQKHLQRTDLPRQAGWWGNDPGERFKMEKTFIPKPTAEGWQVSTVQILSCAALKASLEIFDQTDMSALRTKSLELTGYLESELNRINRKNPQFDIITPANPAERGAQLSILTGPDGKQVFNRLTANGVIGDWREPNVIRLAPAPLYNSLGDVQKAARIIESR